MKKDIEKMSFEEMINLQKKLNETITKKRQGDVGDLIRKIKSLNKKRKSLDLEIDELQRLLTHKKLTPLLKKHFDNIGCFINSNTMLVVYNSSDNNYEVFIDIEAMQIVKSEGYSDDEINSILNIVNDVINSEDGDATDELLKRPYSEQLEIFKSLESDELLTDSEADDFLIKYNLQDVDLNRFVAEFEKKD